MKTTTQLQQQLAKYTDSDIRAHLQDGDSLVYNATQDRFYVINDETMSELNLLDWNPLFSSDQIFGLTQHEKVIKEILLQSMACTLVNMEKVQ